MNRPPPGTAVSAARRSISPSRWLTDLPIRIKLTLAFILVIFLTLALMDYAVNRTLSSELRENVGRILHNRAEARAQIIGSWLRMRSEDLIVLGLAYQDDLNEINASYTDDTAAAQSIAERERQRTPQTLMGRSDVNPELIHDYVKSSPFLVEVLLSDRYGGLIATSTRAQQIGFAQEEWWQAASSGGQGAIYVGAPESHGAEGVPVIPIAAPIFDPDSGELLGVVRGMFYMTELSALMDSLRFGETGRGRLILPGAQVLARDGTLSPLDPSTRDALALVVAQEYAEMQFEGEPSLTSQAEILLPPGGTLALAPGWRVVVIQSVEESMEPLLAARTARMTSGLVMLIAAGLVGYVLAGLLTAPIRQLAGALREFSDGDRTRRAEVRQSDEIGQLAAAFDTMADAIQTRDIEVQQWVASLDRTMRDHTTELTAANESLKQEIAAREKAQEQVLLERLRLEALINSSHDGLILVSVDRQVQVINQMALNLLNLPGIPQDWLNYTIGELQVSDGMVLEGLQQLRNLDTAQHDDEPTTGEFQTDTHVVEWLNLPVASQNVPFGRLIVLHDVTQDRLLERMRDDLTSTMVHDLRNPLGSILIALELFQGDNLTDEQREMLAVSTDSVNRMQNLVNAILDIGRFEAGSMPVDRVHIPLHEIAEDILRIQLPLALNKKITLQDNVNADLPLLEADKDLIGRVIQNLVGNAIKFTPDGGQVSLSAEPAEPGFLVISVRDTGPGIAPDVRDRLFQKFATGKQKGRGSGLGLAFSRLAVEAHGGRIWVESSTGEGTTFKFTLPLAQAQPAAAEHARKEDQGEQAPST